MKQNTKIIYEDDACTLFALSNNYEDKKNFFKQLGFSKTDIEFLCNEIDFYLIEKVNTHRNDYSLAEIKKISNQSYEQFYLTKKASNFYNETYKESYLYFNYLDEIDEHLSDYYEQN